MANKDDLDVKELIKFLVFFFGGCALCFLAVLALITPPTLPPEPQYSDHTADFNRVSFQVDKQVGLACWWNVNGQVCIPMKDFNCKPKKVEPSHWLEGVRECE